MLISSFSSFWFICRHPHRLTTVTGNGFSSPVSGVPNPTPPAIVENTLKSLCVEISFIGQSENLAGSVMVICRVNKNKDLLGNVLIVSLYDFAVLPAAGCLGVCERSSARGPSKERPTQAVTAWYKLHFTM